MSLIVAQFPCLSDNYGFLIHDRESGETVAIDTPDAQRIHSECEQRDWILTQIWNTHHHFDHSGGNEALKDKTNAKITGPAGEDWPIPAMDRAVREGDTVQIGNFEFSVIDVPGHTKGHIAYINEEQKLAFVGDTLFALGCGRLFEGTASQMWESLLKLRTFDPEVKVYSAHEYTQSNAKFAITIEPWNEDLIARDQEIDRMRENGEPTVPTTIGLESRTNPFLRADQPKIAEHLGLVGRSDVDVFATIRQLKDEF